MSADRNTVAVGYVRVATGSARKREESVSLQRQPILRYAQNNGIRIGRFFADHDCVSDIGMRQGLNDAMAYIAKGKASVLMIAELTRLTRFMDDFLCFIQRQEALKDGPSLISVHERLDTRTAEGRVMLGTIHTLTQWESSELARGA